MRIRRNRGEFEGLGLLLTFVDDPATAQWATVGEAPAPQLTDRSQSPPQRGNGRERLAPTGRTQAHATVTRAGARQRCRGRRARSGVHRGVGADLLDVLRRPLVDELLQEVGRERGSHSRGSGGRRPGWRRGRLRGRAAQFARRWSARGRRSLGVGQYSVRGCRSWYRDASRRLRRTHGGGVRLQRSLLGELVRLATRAPVRLHRGPRHVRAITRPGRATPLRAQPYVAALPATPD